MSQQEEPIKSTTMPTRPWQQVATDLFTQRNVDYLLYVDYYSRYFEVEALSNTRSHTVITKTKEIFARHGIPDIVRSDNGPQYSSKEFAEFAKAWKFQHITSSPGYPQSNGLAEKTVQTVKHMMNKSEEPQLAFLEYRNTPVDQNESPAQLLMSHRLRSLGETGACTP